MIVRNGVRSTLRARGRTILFTLLILLLTVALALGLGMWAYCAQTLAAMDESYASVALVEYMGENYPERDAADEYARQAAQALDGATIAAIDGVELWEESDQALAALSGYQRDLGAIPYKDYAVVVATNLSPMTPTQSFVTEADLSCRAIQDGELVSLYGPDGELQAQVPYYEYGVDWSIGRAGYYSLEIDEDGVRRYTLVAEEDLPEVRYVLDCTSRSTPPYQGQYYGPDLGWDTQGYMGYAAGNGQYLIYDVVYSGSITQTLYSQDGRDNILAIFEAGDTGFVPERGRRYLLHGTFVQGASSNATFAVTDFYEGCDTPPYLELSGADDPALTDSLFVDYADYYQLVNNYVRLEASDDVAALECFPPSWVLLAKPMALSVT